ncbi:type II secretion system F family protein [Monashia sp. NPDC004114]
MIVTASALVVALLLAAAVGVLPSRTHASDEDVRTAGEGNGRQDVGPGAVSSDHRSASGTSASRTGRRRIDSTAGDADISAAMTLLALAYRSGLPTWDVLLAVATGARGAVSRDLRQVAAALRWGAGEWEAWGSVGPGWSPAARAVAIAQQAGVPPGPMLLAAAEDLRHADLDRLEVGAARAGVRLVAPLGLVLLPAFCLTTVVPLVIALAGRLMAG